MFFAVSLSFPTFAYIPDSTANISQELKALKQEIAFLEKEINQVEKSIKPEISQQLYSLITQNYLPLIVLSLYGFFIKFPFYLFITFKL